MRPLILSVDYQRYSGHIPGIYVVRDGKGGSIQQNCHSRLISTDELIIDCPTPGEVGAKWLGSFPEIGILRGNVIRVDGPRTAVLQIIIGTEGRRRLATTIRWLVRRDRGLSKELRRAPRVAPRQPHTQVSIGQQGQDQAILLDISATGAKITSELQLELGTEILVGSIPARVVRVEKRAFGVEFLEPLLGPDIETELHTRSETVLQA
ncbi:PilZ domain-containing protein [Devosia sp. 2618]|uniref:PilZ domain-containing protein n=1 Tax=Devosia sp. 2618 TaxID=3156454 RepID=UPI0033920E60